MCETTHHLRESKQQQRSSAEGVNGPEGGEGKQEVDQTESHGGDHGGELAETRILEYSPRVESDDVDAAKLLSKHDREGGDGGSSDSRNGEETSSTGPVVVPANDSGLDRNLSMDVVDITSNLDRVVSQQSQGLPRLGIAVLLHEPTGGLRAKVDQAHERDGRDEGRTEHESPVMLVVEDSQVNNSAEKDTEGGPHLYRRK